LDNIVFLYKLIMVKSAGNDRNDFPPGSGVREPFSDCFQENLGYPSNCIGPKGVAKNVITVGAVDGTDRVLDGQSPIKIANFSSFGPTIDGRIKPDLMAQGVHMASLSPDKDKLEIMGGTSMAAPVVTGIAALVLQDAKTHGVVMSPAGMKALLIQTANDLKGIEVASRTRAHPGPDYATGWGIVDAKAAIDLLRQSGLVHDKLKSRDAWEKTITVASNTKELRVTLAWDDPRPEEHAKVLVNDLDLYLIAPDKKTRHGPWILDPYNPTHEATKEVAKDGAALARKDDTNNVEQVHVTKPTAGTWTIVVTAASLSMDQEQSFAVAAPFK
jgi:hypothetical protein